MATTIARLQAILSADTTDFDRAMKTSDSRMQKTGKVAGLAGLAIAGGLAFGLKKSVDAAMDAQKEQVKLESQMKALGISYKSHQKIIESTIDKTSKLAAVDDEELGQSFTRLLPATKNVGKALDQMRLATDIARARNIDLNAATQLVIRANTGSAGALRKLGINLVKTNENVTQARDALSAYKDAHKEISPEMEAHFRQQIQLAKAADLRAQAEINIATLQKTFAGAAKDYGETSAAAQERLQVATENLLESLGMALLPIVTEVSNGMATLAGWMTENEDVTKKVIIGIGILAATLLTVSVAMKIAAAASAIQSVAFVGLGASASAADKLMRLTLIGLLATLVISLVLAYKRSEEFRDIVNRAFQAVADTVGPILEDIVKIVSETMDKLAGFWEDHGAEIIRIVKKSFSLIAGIMKPYLEAVAEVIRFWVSVFKGDWGEAWEHLKGIVGKTLQAVVNTIETFGDALLIAGSHIGRFILDGIANGIRGAWELVKQAAEDLADHIPGWMKKVLGIESASKVMSKEVGENVSLGVAEGILKRKLDIANALVKAAEDAVEKARARVGMLGDRLASSLTDAFRARQSGARTKTELLLEQLDEQNATNALNDEKIQAEKEVTSALASTAEDREELILAAGKRLAAANYAITIAGLQKTAAAERKELEGRQTFEAINFETRLGALQTYLASGHADTVTATLMIRDLMSDFNIEISDIGELLGLNYAAGIEKQIPAAVAAARSLREAVAAELRAEKARDSIQGALDALQKRSEAMNKKYNLPSGDRSGPAPTVPGPSAGGSTLDQLKAFAHSLGFNPSSGQMDGGTHVPGSLHYQGKAIDLSGSASAMRNAFFAAIQTFGTRINELFYDPIGWYMDQGQKMPGAMGGHSNHVHVGLYDKGGYLRPGWNLAYNGLGRPEPVGAGGDSYHFTFSGFYGDERELINKIRTMLKRNQRRN